MKDKQLIIDKLNRLKEIQEKHKDDEHPTSVEIVQNTTLVIRWLKWVLEE